MLKYGESMKSIKESELHLFVGRKVRVTYKVERPMEGMSIPVDEMITPEGCILRKYDPNKKVATIEMPNGSMRDIPIYQIFCTE